MKLVRHKGKQNLVKKRDTYKCISCDERPGAKQLDVYEIENGKKTKMAIICKACAKMIIQNGIEDRNIEGYATMLKNKDFLRWLLAQPARRKPWHKKVYGNGKD